MVVDYGEAVVWLWTSPATLATVAACLGAQVALVASGKPGGPLAAGPRRRIMALVPLLGVFLWFFIASSLLMCISQAAQEDYSIRHVLQIIGAGVAAAAGATLLLSATVFVLAPRRILARAGARPPSGSELELLAEAWEIMGVGHEPPVRMVDGGGTDCYTVGGPSSTIVISSTLFKGLSQRERAAILSHECGHVQNGDALANTIGGIAERILFFDPFLKMIGPLLRRQSEYAADAASTLVGLGPDLASALTRISGGHRGGPTGSGAIVGDDRGWRSAHPPLERRLARLARRGYARP